MAQMTNRKVLELYEFIHPVAPPYDQVKKLRKCAEIDVTFMNIRDVVDLMRVQQQDFGRIGRVVDEKKRYQPLFKRGI